MKKRRSAYISSIALSIACSLLIVVTALFIARPSLAKKVQHQLYRAGQASHTLVEDPNLDRQIAGPEGKQYHLSQVLQGQSDLDLFPSLLLVSPNHPLAQDYEADLVTDTYSQLEMSPLMVEDFAALSQAVSQEFSEKLYVSSLYRTAQGQAEIFAEEPDLAMPPGASEHQTGLALDVYVYQFAGQNFINAPAGRWVNENAWKYGFVIRYPQGQEDLTGMTFEPWHLRYVGQPHAEILTSQGWVLESYLDQIQPNHFYRFGSYILLRTKQENFCLPAQLQDGKISPDNLGFYVIWGQMSS